MDLRRKIRWVIALKNMGKSVSNGALSILLLSPICQIFFRYVYKASGTFATKTKVLSQQNVC